MKSRVFKFLSLCLLLTVRLPADEPLLVRPPEQVDQLLGPIALYPDALIALILPASTVPSDIALAARYLEVNGDLEGIEDESWDDSVKSLAHYSDVVRWMNQNLAWTKQLGDAFLAQPTEVMNSVQRLRVRARAAGALVDTPQQQIVYEGDTICILPAQPDVIYIPSYDPDIVYVSRPGYYSDPFLTFGVGYAAGFWLGYDMDWGRHRIWTIDRRDRERYWRDHHDWPRPSYSDRSGHTYDSYRHQQWGPRTSYPRSSGNYSHNESTNPRPPRDVSPNRAPDSRWNGSNVAPTSGDRHQRSGSDHRDSTTYRRPENHSSPAVQPNNVTTAQVVPAPSAPSVQPQLQTQSPRSQPNQRDRQDRAPRGYDRREAQANSPTTRVAPSQPPPERSPSTRSIPAAANAETRPSSPPPSARSAPPPSSSTRSDRDERPGRQSRSSAPGE